MTPGHVIEIKEWEVTFSSIASPEISILIDCLLDMQLIEYFSNPGNKLTEAEKKFVH